LRLLLPIVCLLLLAPAAHAQERVVTDLQLLDPVLRQLRPASLYLVDGRIEAIGAPDGSEFDASIVRWSADGRFATPGFLDVSVFARTMVSPGHRDRLQDDHARMLFLAAGVHEVIDLAVSADSTFAHRGAPVLVAPDGAGAEIPGATAVDNVQDARALVATLLAHPRAPDRLSVILDRGRSRRSLTAATLTAILDTAGDTPVAVYVGTWRDAMDALEAGARWLVQIPPGPVPAPVLERVQELRPLWTPAVAVGMDFMALMKEQELRESAAFLRALPPQMRADYGEVRVLQSRLSEARLQNEDRLTALRDLHDAGAQFVAGSQSGGLGTAHGWSFLRELQWWAQAGIDGWSILAAATWSPDLSGPAGFTAGMVADFNLYAASPVDDAGQYGSLELVFAGGEVLDPEALAGRVSHSLTEDIPDNPLPGDNQWSLLIIAVTGFAVLLFLRRLVKRAAANAVDS